MSRKKRKDGKKHIWNEPISVKPRGDVKPAREQRADLSEKLSSLKNPIGPPSPREAWYPKQFTAPLGVTIGRDNEQGSSVSELPDEDPENG